MPRVRPSSIHDHWVKTIKSHYGKIVARLDLTFINLDFLDWSLFKFDILRPLEEFQIGLLHVLRDMWLEKWNFTMEAKATDECLKAGVDREQLFLEGLTEEVCLETEVGQVGLCGLCWQLECQFVGSSEPEILNVGHLGVTEQEKVGAGKVSWVVGLDYKMDFVSAWILHINLNFLEAISLK